MDNKLLPQSYSQTYRQMFLALIERLNPQHITKDCSAKDIDADAIIFFDPHSTHHIQIRGLREHPAIKYEFMDDPHQIGMTGVHLTTGVKFTKLGAGSRINRIMQRGIEYIICPHKAGFFWYFRPYLGTQANNMLVHFPCAPSISGKDDNPLSERKNEVLANGATRAPLWFPAYKFRKWAFKQPEVSLVEHYIENKDTPCGDKYSEFLGQYAGVLALADTYVCPKHLQIPLAGCVCFVQESPEYRSLGFRDYGNCVYINKSNFKKRITHFLDNIDNYQHIADAGRKLVENNYTAEHFARYINNHIKEKIHEKRRSTKCN